MDSNRSKGKNERFSQDNKREKLSLGKVGFSLEEIYEREDCAEDAEERENIDVCFFPLVFEVSFAELAIY